MVTDIQGQLIWGEGRKYLEAGLALVPLQAGQKRPTGVAWNDSDNVITDPDAWFLDAAGCGLAHVQSRTCTLDVDDYRLAVDWLSERDIDLVSMQMREDTVQIVSGKKNRAKLLFKLPDGVDPLETRQPEGSGLELRCAASNGKTLQDCLPPSVHPDTGKPYTWLGDWKRLPTLPDKLLELWQSLSSRTTTAPDLGDDEFLKALAGNGLLVGAVKGKAGAHEIICPWAAEHTNGGKAAMYFAPHTNGYAGAGFRCLHAHCAARGIDDLARFLGVLSASTLTLGGKPLAECTAAPETVSENRKPKQADVLIEIAGAAGLFHTHDGASFADITVNGHRETWPVRSKGFKGWLRKRYFEDHGGAPNSEAMQSALGVVEAQAAFDGPEREAHVRMGSHHGKVYLDLCDDAWRAVEISDCGWQILNEAPIRFRRAAGMKPLPVPKPGGVVNDLKEFLNVASENDFYLAVAWVLAVLRDSGPYPVLVLAGEQGSAKSTFSAILRSLLDPNAAPLRALPREDRDLFIAANNGHILAFDNVSRLPHWISDTLCRLSTGGGFAVRQLYADQEEVLFDAQRPIILNGITDIVERPDLADRAIFLNLEPIPEHMRKQERDVWADFEAKRPKLLGALLGAVCAGLKNFDSTRLKALPRMADFAQWIVSCEAALWPSGRFMAAYTGNINDAVDSVIDSMLVGGAIRDFMSGGRTVWTGNSTDLLVALTGSVPEQLTKSKDWPKTPEVLSNRVTRAATFLRKAGIDVQRGREPGRKRGRTIRITVADWVRKTYGKYFVMGSQPEQGAARRLFPTILSWSPYQPLPIKISALLLLWWRHPSTLKDRRTSCWRRIFLRLKPSSACVPARVRPTSTALPPGSRRPATPPRAQFAICALLLIWAISSTLEA